MRIITGKHKSRVLKTLKGPNTRPMMDRMKESVFNTIDSYIEGANVLDLFGGSGALSLEAISRGAKHSSISEINYEAYKVILENVQTLKEENNVTIYKMSYQKLLQVIKENEFKFDLVFVDPPYKLEVANLIIEELITINTGSKQKFKDSSSHPKTLDNCPAITGKCSFLRIEPLYI